MLWARASQETRCAGCGASREISDRFHHVHLPIKGMDCSDCVTVIEHSVGRLDGVLAVNVNYAAEMMRVECILGATGIFFWRYTGCAGAQLGHAHA